MTKQYSTIYLLAMCNELQVNENKINVVMKANTDSEGMKEKALFLWHLAVGYWAIALQCI